MTLTPGMVLYPDGRGDADSVANIDWATGVILNHFPRAQFMRLTSARLRDEYLSAEDQFLLEGVVHEAFHLMQFLTTGYGYRLSARFLVSVYRAFSAADLSLEAVREQRDQFAGDIDRAHDELEAPGPEGVSVLDLLEGSAFMFQKRSWGGHDPISYEEALLQAPGHAYRHAYDVAVTVLGEGDAWLWFNHVISLALKAVRPQDVYVPLLELFNRQASSHLDAAGRLGRNKLDWTTNHRLGLDGLDALPGGSLIGEPLALTTSGIHHPILSPAIERLDALTAQGTFEPLAFAVMPHEFSPEVARLMFESPRLFPPPVAGREPEMWQPQGWVNKRDGLGFGTLMYLCAASAILTGDFNEFP